MNRKQKDDFCGGRGIRTPKGFHPAVFKTAALPVRTSPPRHKYNKMSLILQIQMHKSREIVKAGEIVKEIILSVMYLSQQVVNIIFTSFWELNPILLCAPKYYHSGIHFLDSSRRVGMGMTLPIIKHKVSVVFIIYNDSGYLNC